MYKINIKNKMTFQALYMIGITFISKALGFAREVIISSTFGASLVTDIFFTVQTIPSSFANYMTGAFNLPYIPAYLTNERNNSLYSFFKFITNKLVIVGGVISLLLAISSYFFSDLIFNFNDNTLARNYLIIFSFVIIPIMFSGVGNGILHARNDHVYASIYSMIAPVFMLLGLIILPFVNVRLEYVLPLSFSIGYIINYYFFNIIIKKNICRSNDNKAIGIDTFKKELFASTGENVIFNINIITTALVIGLCNISGGVSTSSYAYKISFLFSAGLIGPINQILQRWLAVDSNNRKLNKVMYLFSTMLLVTILIAFIIITFRKELTELIYYRGNFTYSNLIATSELLIPYSIYFVVQSLSAYWARVYFASRLGRVYSLTISIGYLLAIALKFVLYTNFSINGVIWSMVIAEGICVIILTMIYIKKSR